MTATLRTAKKPSSNGKAKVKAPENENLAGYLAGTYDPKKAVVAIEMIGPKVARQLLAYNKYNRNLSQKTVGAYARDMARGNWMFTGDPIRFTTEAEMIDGQHRAHAVIESGKTLPFVVVYGLDPKAKHALDMGRRRSTANVLHFKGYSQTTRLASAARALYGLKYGQSSARITSAEIIEIVERHPRLGENAHHFNKCEGLSPSLLSALYYVLRYLMDDEKTAEAMYQAMRYGSAPKALNPFIAVRDRAKSTLPSNYMSRGQLWRALIHATNKYRKDETMERVKVPEQVELEGLDTNLI